MLLTCGHENDVCLHLLLLPILHTFGVEHNCLTLHLRAVHLDSKLEFKALLCQRSLEGLPDLTVLQYKFVASAFCD